MATFKASNIESDTEEDPVVDDTKELQIEDALKLYQNALKLHAQGPVSFPQAAEAYAQLFDSEIFRYPESQLELRRIELYGPLIEDDDGALYDGEGDVASAVTAGGEGSSSTLPQILHLSHKNYARFKLEALTAQLDTFNVGLKQILTEATTALEHFVQAIDKDDTDLDLWRRTARVGEMLHSQRVARFCLEAVLEGDEEGLNGVLSLPGLEDGLAGVQLRELVTQLEDRLSMLQSSLSGGKRRVLPKMLKQRLVSYAALRERQRALVEEDGATGQTPRQPQRIVLKAPKTWAEVGDVVLSQLMAGQHDTSTPAPGAALGFDPSDAVDPAVRAREASNQSIRNGDAIPSASALEENGPVPGTSHPPSRALDEGNAAAQQGTAVSAVLSIDATASLPPQNDRPPSEMMDLQSTSPTTLTVPSRKRSGDAAGLPDGSEESRSKSRRIRARESILEPADSRQAAKDANTQYEYEQQLIEFQAVDKWLFETAGDLFERIGVVGFERARLVRGEMNADPSDVESNARKDHQAEDLLRTARADVLAFLNDYTDLLAFVLLKGAEGTDGDPSGRTSGLGGTLGSGLPAKPITKVATLPDHGVLTFLETINGSWHLPHEVAQMWLSMLLHPGFVHATADTYTEYTWPEALKTMVVRTLVNFDESIYATILKRVEDWLRLDFDAMKLDDNVKHLAYFTQAIFELHLDIHTLIKQPNSGVDTNTVTAQGDRLERWFQLARDVMQHPCHGCAPAEQKDELTLRFLWTTTFHIAAAPDVSQDHVIECMNDLRAIFVAADEPVILLQNNAVMPELSVAALDREIQRLTTKDFFLKVTNQDLGDPVAVIESLEPLLLSAVDCEGATDDEKYDVDVIAQPAAASVPPELVRFLQSSDVSIRLLLWQRLREAYSAIDYKPMVVSCHLCMMHVILGELKSPSMHSLPQRERQVAMLKSLRLLQDVTNKVFHAIQNADNALECIDAAGLKSAVGGFGEVLQLLHVFNVFEDSIRIGQTQQPSLTNGLPIQSFASMSQMFHEMQLHIWIILYHLLKEAIHQNSDLYPNPAEDKFDLLRCIHRDLGVRGICGGSNRMFVRMLKDEFVHMTHVEGYDSEQAQVLYDLYGLNCFLRPAYELIEHRCTHDAFLDKGAVALAMDLLLAQASKLPIKDLAKHSVEKTIEKVHGVMTRKKPTEAVLRNREVYRAFLRSPINPMDIFNCLKGEGNQLPVLYVPREDAIPAAKGWYFLMGHISLTKFRMQKRTMPTPTEDVEIAIAFFMQDLEYSMENWETWFRLAQAYDTKIEESVVWSAEKLNNSMPEVVQLQRAAIHCYIMATALAYRSAELAFNTSEKMTELYADFGARLYASSREPFSMLPFANEEAEKFMSMPTGIGKSKPYASLRTYTAWKLAKVLLTRAAVGKPKSWTLQYMLGKCLWKMHSSPEHVRLNDQPPPAEQVLETFIRVIDLLPDKKDSRERREPTLEPHYKLVSVVHKLFGRGELGLEQAKEALSHTPYGRALTFPQERSEWIPYVLSLLKNLRAADKSNWHHRMIARAAHIIYEDSDSQLGAIGAKHELTQQMFTKTMVLQVWRPECERAGRHFVYTARYTRFFTNMLEQLKDRSGLEALARRVRRRPHDMIEHSLVWQEMCNAYLRLLRSHAALPEGLETSTFSNIAHEDFLVRKEPLEKWMQAQDATSSAALDVLREVQELKKINQNLMKPGPIDDLIGDSYAYLFNTIGKQLWEEQVKTKRDEEARKPPVVVSPQRNPTMSLTHLMNLDGAGPSSTTAQAPLSGPAPPPPTAPSDLAPARRKIGVGRREIRICAEGCAQKASAVTAAKTSLAANTRVQVVIETSRATDLPVETSAPGSIHDSADDESELSELEEDDGDDEGDGGDARGGAAPARPVFPGLASLVESREGSFETADEGQTGAGDDVSAEGRVEAAEPMGQGS